jgi:hypothetical protein
MTEMIAYPASISKIKNRHSSIVNPPSAPSALLGDLPARHTPQDGGGCAFAVHTLFFLITASSPMARGAFTSTPSNTY